jgi:hypothetical protein
VIRRALDALCRPLKSQQVWLQAHGVLLFRVKGLLRRKFAHPHYYSVPSEPTSPAQRQSTIGSSDRTLREPSKGVPALDRTERTKQGSSGARTLGTNRASEPRLQGSSVATAPLPDQGSSSARSLRLQAYGSKPTRGVPALDRLDLQNQPQPQDGHCRG